MENTHNNNIHKNQIINYITKNKLKCLFFSPILNVSKSGIFINKKREYEENKYVDEIKVPFASYNFLMGVFSFLPIFIYCVCRLTIYVRKNGVEVIHARNHFSSIVAVAVKKLTPLKVISDFRGLYADEGVVLSRWRKKDYSYKLWTWLEKLIINYSDKVTCVSQSMCSHLEKYGINNKLVYTPAIVDTSKFYYDEKLRIKIRNNLNIDTNCVIFIYVGSLGQWHTFDKMLSLINDFLLDKNVDYRLILLGNHNIESESPYGGSDKLIIRNVNPDAVNEFLNAADIGLLPGSFHCTESYNDIYKTMISSKAEEYLVTGLEILSDDRISEISKLLKEVNTMTRADKSLFFKNTFSLESVSDKYRELYS